MVLLLLLPTLADDLWSCYGAAATVIDCPAQVDDLRSCYAAVFATAQPSLLLKELLWCCCYC